MDYGRQNDLEELANAIDGARSTQEREYYEKLVYRIMQESAPIRSLREELIKAFRARDMNRVKRIQEHIQKVRMDETYGKSWGNNKGEKKLIS